MYSFKLVLLVSIFCCNGNCFNIDTDFPIIYSDPSVFSKFNKSYFGYSVVLYDGKNDSAPWIQIGAPRGHDPLRYSGFTQPGLVYRCGINRHCDIFLVDMRFPGTPPNEIGDWPNVYIPKKDKAWIGANMDIDPVNERLVICAPRWLNIQDQQRYIEGACYWSDLVKNDTKELLPLINRNRAATTDLYDYALGQAGMSLHIPNTSTYAPQIVMGAPGVRNWRGTIISYQDTRSKPFQTFTVVETTTIKEVYSFAYLGYSISSGYFFSPSQLSFVASAPRGSLLKGQVLVFTFGQRQNIKVKQVRTGKTIGEYYGAAIGVADINGDGLDDLIIGAPHFSVKSDEGRIYISYGNRRNVLLPADQSLHITGNYTGGQFGLAIQSLGDIDNDGCHEIAVGAPYEDEEHGVIYIYKGVKTTTSNPILVQRIEGKRLYINLRGFGISFSKPTDIDKNNMKDIAVGSFLSDNAVLLRTRPVVELQMAIKSYEKELDRKSTNFSIEICFKFTGQHLPKFLNITRKIILDSNHRRAYQSGFPINTMEYEDEITIVFDEMTCHNTSIRLKTSPDNKNGWQPIIISVSQELVEPKRNTTPLLVSAENPNIDHFCNYCPVVNKFISTRERKIEVPFALNCGEDNICQSDLNVSAEFKDIQNDQFIIGARKTLSLQINVTNTNESAYFTEVVVLLPENVFLSAKPVGCDEKNINNTLVIVCFVDNPLETGKWKNITIDLDMESINELPKYNVPLSFQINVTTNSRDITPDNNRIVKNLTLTRDAYIQITGKMEKMYYFGSDPFSNATVVYEVQKSGVSPLNEFSLNVTLPVAYKKGNEEITFLAIHRPLGLQNSQPFSCFWPEEYIKDAEVFDKEGYKHNNTRKKRATDDSILNETISEAPKDKTKFLNCDMDDVVCKTVSCTIGPFNKMLKGASLQIKLVLNATELHNLVGDNIAVHISTIGAVKEIEGILLDQIEVSSTFLKASEDEKLDTWIIIVAVASGILILLIIILGLVKAGFFERKQKAKLEELKQREVEEEFNVREPSTECVSENEEELDLTVPPKEL